MSQVPDEERTGHMAIHRLRIPHGTSQSEGEFQEPTRIVLTSSIFHIVLRTVAREIVRNFGVLGGFMDDTDGHWAPAAKKQWSQ